MARLSIQASAQETLAMKRMSATDVYTASTTTLSFFAAGVPVVVSYMGAHILTDHDMAETATYIGLSALGYFTYFKLCAWVLHGWRYRDWLGNWFYVSTADERSRNKDAGVAWMYIIMRDGELEYKVERYENFNAFAIVYKQRNGLIQGLGSRLWPWHRRAGGRHRGSHKQLGASSETILFDNEENSLVIFYHAQFSTLGEPERRGRLQLELTGHRSEGRAFGRYSSLVAKERNAFTVSHGTIQAFRHIDDVRTESQHAVAA
jgi:hypothetical protein